ncbi:MULTISPECIES: ABC transporter permease [Thermomonospora]|uniref:Binding-protein-dependent transport systems inner membrane component n=1 Tax=Thermomonospora curvata (strain ATCC 19995 / DSM 43183 / JCM 3096 / KCTC 9072 / NBRC 15933 / NCIMB 10081 / Henssen B9) TaxID=471852 RepID=D1AA20_THECD|nr:MULTISPECIES: ABC transporter permease [Thermomonospora]ACY96956.1 binding-protein-dependent transport systems inner membrane component [Thermomonospora curvata DSM 43183]PKK15233.1 MAG: ABC transporter permease [Thermomonospora sp. CIF 1]
MTVVDDAAKARPLPVRTLRWHPAQRRSARPRRRGRALDLAVRALVPVALLAAWQLVASLGWVDPQVLPGPLVIVDAYAELLRTGELQAALPVSLQRAGIGLAIGGGTGLLLGVAAGLWAAAERLYDAPLQMLRTIPFIAMVPLFIVWFGIGEESKIALIVGASIFPVYLNTYHGIRGIDRRLIELAQTFELSRRQVIGLIVVPLAMPQILVGLRYAAGTALLALVAAEQINTVSGIGYILNNANQNQRTDIIIAGILVYAALGIVVDVLMRLLEKALLPWRLTHDGK